MRSGVRRCGGIAILLILLVFQAGCNQVDTAQERESKANQVAEAVTQYDRYLGYDSARITLQWTLEELLAKERFDELDSLFEQFESEQVSYGHYVTGSELIYSQFAEAATSQPELYEVYLDRWEKAKPDSKYPLLARASMRTRHLMTKTWRTFDQRQELGRLHTVAHQAVWKAQQNSEAADDAELWESYLRLAIFTGLPSELYDKILAEVRVRDSSRWEAVAWRAFAESPRWRPVKGFDSYRKTVEVLTEKYGPEAAAVCSAHLLNGYMGKNGANLRKVGFDVPTVRSGFEELRADVSPHRMIQSYQGQVAVALQDTETARKVLEDLGSGWETGVWGVAPRYWADCESAGVEVPAPGGIEDLAVNAGPEFAVVNNHAGLKYRKFFQDVRSLFFRERFLVLEKIRKNYLQEPYTLGVFYSACQYVYSQDSVEKGLDVCRRWEEVTSDPAAVNIVKATVLVDGAWAYRGGGWAREVTEEGWEGFKRYLEQAPPLLEELPDPKACELRVKVAMGLGEPFEVVDRAVERSQELEPGSGATLTSALLFLYPRWHGGPNDLQDYLSELMSRYGDDIALPALYGLRDFRSRAFELIPYELIDRGLTAAEERHGVTAQLLQCRFELEATTGKKERLRPYLDYLDDDSLWWWSDMGKETLRKWVEGEDVSWDVEILESGQYANRIPEARKLTLAEPYPLIAGRSLGLRLRYGFTAPKIVQRVVQLTHVSPTGKVNTRYRREALPSDFLFEGREELILWDIHENDSAGTWLLEVQLDGRTVASREFACEKTDRAPEPGLRLISRGTYAKDPVLQDFVKLDETGDIPAKLGNIFGIQVHYTGVPSKAYFDWMMPSLSGGSMVKEGRFNVDLRQVAEGIRLPSAMLVFILEKPSELRPGEWRIDSYINDRDTGSVKFYLVK